VDPDRFEEGVMTNAEHPENHRSSGATELESAGDLTIRQGGAREITAKHVKIRQGGVVQAHADQIEITQGGIVLAEADEIEVTAGGIVGGLANELELEGAMAHVVVARERAEIDQSMATIIAAREATVKDSAVGVLLAGKVEGDGIRVLMNVPSVLAFGAAAGVVFWLLSRFVTRR
jgi:hypothetical protein